MIGKFGQSHKNDKREIYRPIVGQMFCQDCKLFLEEALIRKYAGAAERHMFIMVGKSADKQPGASCRLIEYAQSV